MSSILRNFFWAVSSVNRMLRMSGSDTTEPMSPMRAMHRFGVQPKRRSMLQMQSLDAADDEAKTEVMSPLSENMEATYVDALTISSRLEHRIMTVDEEIDLQSEEMLPMTNYFKRLPSFVNMERLPRRQSLLAILKTAEQTEDVDTK